MQANVLLVDDEIGIIRSIKRLLHTDQYTVYEANDGLQALDILRRQHIDILITDYQMPRCDGITLCRQARTISPTSYRLLLSGQVDYDILKKAWQDGDVHRFIAKPWDNVLLALDITEGLKQNKLLSHTLKTQQDLSEDQAIVLMDNNWIIRLANTAFCNMLGIGEHQLIGQNLFSAGLSVTAVTQEAELTRQVENDNTWLGYFSLRDAKRDELPVWLALSPVGGHYRIGVCQPIAPDRLQQSNPKQVIEQYADGSEAAVCTTPNKSNVLIIDCPESEFPADLDVISVLQVIKSICGNDCEVYPSPKPNVFTCFIPNHYRQPDIEQLTLALETKLEFGAHQLPPRITLEAAPVEESERALWIQQKMRVSLGTNLPAEQTSPTSVIPIFDEQGQIIAVECRQIGHLIKTDWDQWFDQLTLVWNEHFDRKISIVIDTAGKTLDEIDQFLLALEEARQHASIDCYVQLDEDHFINQSESTIEWHETLTRHHCKRLLTHFGRSFLNVRQILNLPVDGVSLADEFLAHLNEPKHSQQAARLIHKLHEQGVLIYARNIHQHDVLATTKKADISWISGPLMSSELDLSELHWYGPDSALG